MNKNYNIAYATDNNYVQYMMVSMASVMENNMDAEAICFYVLNNRIEQENIKLIEELVKKYNRSVDFIPTDDLISKLELNMLWEISVSTYLRLFLGSVIPVEKVLYLDCDTVIVDSILDFWNTDISNEAIAGVRDVGYDKSKINVGLLEKDEYINAGIILINLEYWRKNAIEEKFLDFLDDYKGQVYHHDQGILNGVLHDHIKIIHPRYNLLTAYVNMKQKSFVKLFNIQGPMYQQEEIDRAIEKPICIHFTPFFTNRPWEKGCKHKLKSYYFKYRDITPWKSCELITTKVGKKTQIINWLFSYLPFGVALKIYKVISKLKNKSEI